MFGLYIYGIGCLVSGLRELSIDLYMLIDKDKSLFTNDFLSCFHTHQFIFHIHSVFCHANQCFIEIGWCINRFLIRRSWYGRIRSCGRREDEKEE